MLENKKPNAIKTGNGHTREDALADLIPKINWTDEEMAQIKRILE